MLGGCSTLVQRTTHLILIGAVVAVITAACSSDRGETAAGAQVTPVPAQELRALLSAEQPLDYSPLRPYLRTDMDAALEEYAIQVVASRCMSRFGLNYQIPSFEQTVAHADLSTRNGTGRLYGVSSEAAARNFGYMPEEAATPYPGRPWPSDTEQLRVLAGSANPDLKPMMDPGTYNGRQIPAGGCLGEATVAVEGSLNMTGEMRFRAGQDAWLQGVKAAQSDPAYQAAEQEWAQCMASKGYRFTRVLEPGEGLTNRSPNSEPTKGEVETALADVACKEQKDTITKLNQVSARYEQRELDANREVLAKEKKELDAMTERTVAIISSGGETNTEPTS